MKEAAIALVVLGALICAVPADAAMYTGSLTYTPPPPIDSADELNVLGAKWSTYNVTMSWVVTDEDDTYPEFPWKYTYTFCHDGHQGGISHMVLEFGEVVTIDDITDFSGASVESLGIQAVSSGNHGMPEDVYGIRVNPHDEDFCLTFSFYCNRLPTWGDFYAKNGGGKKDPDVAYNYNDSDRIELGFLDPDGDDSNRDDFDPANPPCNGSIDYHLLVPSNVFFPEPATISLAGLGSLFLLRRRRRRS